MVPASNVLAQGQSGPESPCDSADSTSQRWTKSGCIGQPMKSQAIWGFFDPYQLSVFAENVRFQM
jgi:hypothetical protein